MEYVVSFLMFFTVYFGMNYLVSIGRTRAVSRKANSVHKKSLNQKYNSDKNRNTVSKGNNKGEFQRLLKNSIIVSFVYIVIIIILKLFY